MASPEEAHDGGRSGDGRHGKEQVDGRDPTRVQVRGERAAERRAHDAEKERGLAEERDHHRVLPAQGTSRSTHWRLVRDVWTVLSAHISREVIDAQVLD